jgi:sirohydrochlorin ferrochelatase
MLRPSGWAALAGLTALAVPAASTAAQTGVLVVAHGAGPEWNKRVRETVSQVQWPHGPVAVAFLMGPDSQRVGWNAGVDTLVARGAKRIVVVPLMVSTYGGHYEEIAFYAGVRDSAPSHHAGHTSPRPLPVPMSVTRALDDAPEIGRILAEQWKALDASARRAPIALVAHGPNSDEDAARWIANLTRAVEPLRLAGAPAISIHLLRDDAPPPVRAAAVAALREQIKDTIVVFSVLISSGTINTVKIPRDLEGMPVRYVPTALAPHAELSRWIERVASQQVEAQ